jgi:hypothetical protein
MDQGKWIVLKGILLPSNISFKNENDSALTSGPLKTKTSA